MDKANVHEAKTRTAYKKKAQLKVYTIKLPEDMILWLRNNEDGAGLIRRLICVLMNDASQNSVIPNPISSPSKLSQPSQVHTLPSQKIRIVEKRLGKR